MSHADTSMGPVSARLAVAESVAAFTMAPMMSSTSWCSDVRCGGACPPGFVRHGRTEHALRQGRAPVRMAAAAATMLVRSPGVVVRKDTTRGSSATDAASLSRGPPGRPAVPSARHSRSGSRSGLRRRLRLIPRRRPSVSRLRRPPCFPAGALDVRAARRALDRRERRPLPFLAFFGAACRTSWAASGPAQPGLTLADGRRTRRRRVTPATAGAGAGGCGWLG